MPNVPFVPGVPALSSYSPFSPTLAIADAIGIVSQFAGALFPQWYIADQVTGEVVIEPATAANSLLALSPLGSLLSTVASFASTITSVLGIGPLFPVTASFIEFEYRQDFPIATYPVEAGSFQSYDRITLPFDLRVRLASGGSAAQRQQFLATMQSIANTLDTFTVYTPDGIYPNLSLSHWNFRRTADRGVTLITVDLFFQQILAVGATQVTTASAAIAGQAGTGISQAVQAPNSALMSVPAVNNPAAPTVGEIQ